MKINYWLAAACLAASLPTHATSVFKPIELKDQELSELRGRYVMPGRIVYFGVTMTSTWQNASGDVLGARTSMQVQQNVIKPQFYVSLINEKGDGSTPTNGNGSISGGAGLYSVQGVTQSVRTAGDGNSANNNVDINVKESGQAPAMAANQGQVLNSGASISGSNAAGNLTVSSVNGGVQLNIQANNNQGNSMQRIAGGGMLQAVNLIGGGNQVQNLTQLNVVLRDNLPSAGRLDCNLDQLKSLRSIGY